MMYGDLQGKTALITGASQGIGEAITKALAAEGVQVVITSNDKATLEKVADDIGELGGTVLPITADARDTTELEQVVEHAIAEFNQIDILINNVGSIGQPDSFNDLELTEWQDLFELNILSAVKLCKLTLPYMQQNQWGRILFMSSERAIEPLTNMSHYAMTKAALLSISKSLANEFGKDNITVNSISPGVIPTPSFDKEAQAKDISREANARQYCRNVMGKDKLGSPEDVANMICYLCSEKAKWITGSNLRIDGGAMTSVQN